MFDHIRHNAASTSYKTSGGAGAADNRDEAPTKATDDCKTATMDGDKEVYLCGYELMRDLDFADGASYASGSVNTGWRPNNTNPGSTTNAGFNGIFNFASIFDGNGYSISDLYSKSSTPQNVGLFRNITVTASIRNLGVVDIDIYGIDNDLEIVGGLVGYHQGKIIASYATGAVNGGNGNDTVGGLVGFNHYASIVSCYAMGNVDGGVGDDLVGGLAGSNYSRATITASFATGTTDGGDGTRDNVGALAGSNQGRTIASYAFVIESNGEIGGHDGTAKPDGVDSASGLTATNAGSEWNDASQKTKNAWDFGNNSQPPVLRYADYDGSGGTDYCTMFPVGTICGSTLLPGQGR